MNIAVFHELNRGGARRAANEFSKRLKTINKIDLYFIDDKKNENETSNFTNTLFYKFIPKNWTGKNWKIKLYKDTVELWKLYKLHKKIAKEIDSKKYDFVFIHGSKYTQAPLLLRFLKTKKIYYCQEPLRMVYESVLDNTQNLNFFKKRYEKLNRLIRKRIDRKNILKAGLVLANSKYTQRNIYKSYGINSKVCYMGVDEKVFYPDRKKRKTEDILFIGAYEFVDGYDLLKQGLGLFNRKLNVKILASEVKWIDNDKKLRGLYTGSKIALCLAYNEPFGLIPLEAMACGVPVIAVNEGGYKETIRNDLSGYLIKRDPIVLMKKIGYLLDDQKALEKLTTNTVKYINTNWTWDKQVEKLNTILKDYAKA